MSVGKNITLLGVVYLVYYCLTQIFNFYGVSQSVYDVYFYFYAMLLIFAVILPNEEPSF